jgi:hypothetical protein
MKKILKASVFILFGLLLSCGIGALMWAHAVAQISQGDGNPLFPSEMNAARDAKTSFVIGDLGGVPVRIPSWFANYVEYEGDPGFGERRKGPRPVRTYQSRLISFGFKVRFPDMAGLSSPELWLDYKKYSDPYWKGYYDSISPWIDVGFNTGSIYPGDGFMDRYVKTTLAFNSERAGFGDASKVYEYEKLPESEFGLTVYAPPGIDPKTKNPYREDKNAEDLFVHWTADGKVDTHIKCSNGRLPNLKYTMCSQDISMEPRMRARIYITYPRYWLPHWKEIQQKVSDLVWNFRAKDEVTKAPRDAS